MRQNSIISETREETSSVVQYRFCWANIFKTVFIITMAVIIGSFMLEFPSSQPLEVRVISKNLPQSCNLGLSVKYQNEILQKHNSIRSRVALGNYPINNNYLPAATKMSRLTWDCELESEAVARAKSCMLKTETNGRSNELKDIRGENVFKYRSDDELDGMLKGIEQMGNEITEYGIQSLDIEKFDKRIGHAMQIMWEETRKVGCAIQECTGSSPLDPDFKLAVCKYYPTGNIFAPSNPRKMYTAGENGVGCEVLDPTSGLCIADK